MKREAPATTERRLRHCNAPRLRRLLKALRQGSVTRRNADAVVGTTNGPEYISELKHGYGLSITTEYVSSTDRDGRRTRTGVYHLDPESEELADLLLSEDKPDTNAK